jgi:bifunctional ADP-heptose synthase (sugar kinase/adenylyltransferase)
VSDLRRNLESATSLQSVQRRERRDTDLVDLANGVRGNYLHANHVLALAIAKVPGDRQMLLVAADCYFGIVEVEE